MNLQLAPLSSSQFAESLLRIIEEFALLLQPTRDLTMEQAIAESTSQFRNMLPRGLDTPCQHFRQIMLVPQSTVMNVPQPIGLVWVHINPTNRFGVMCWFEIYRSWRGQKLSRPSLKLVEQWLRDEMKVPVLNLEVFAHNQPAMALYDQCGFTKLGHVLQKKLV